MLEKTDKISRIFKVTGLLMLLGPLLVAKIRSFVPRKESYLAEDCAAIESAKAYNAHYLSGKKCTPYNAVLDQSGTGIMGVIEIPSIGLRAPIYHGTEEKALQNGIGHYEESTLPVGGKGCRCVLTGHRGLPGRDLFLRLDEMTKGSSVVLKIAGRSYTYVVRDIRVLSPKEAEKIAPQKGRDLLTLITCTPFGIHTDRLVIDCERSQEMKKDVFRILSEREVVAGGLVCGAGLLYLKRRKKCDE